MLAYVIKAALKDLQCYPPGWHLANTEEMRFLHSDGLASLLRLAGVHRPDQFIDHVLGGLNGHF